MAPEAPDIAHTCATCRQQLQRYLTYGNDTDTTGCDPLIERSAQHDEAALTCLLDLSQPLIAARCPQHLRHLLDDWAQDVLFIVAGKMRNRASPYTIKEPPPQPFVGYRAFLKVVCRRMSINYTRREQAQSGISLNQLQDQHGIELAHQRSELDELLKIMRLERLMALLPNALDRELFRQRFILGRSTAEAIEALAQTGVTVAKKDVFVSVERSIRYLSKIPEVRELFEDADGNPA